MRPARGLLVLALAAMCGIAGVYTSASASAEATADSSAAATADQQEKPPAQPPTAPDQQPIFRTGINTVRVDVIVTDRQGNPVTDLKLEDFEILEDGKAQKPETFRLVKIDTVTQPAYTQRTIRTRNDEETAAADENSRIFT